MLLIHQGTTPPERGRLTVPWRCPARGSYVIRQRSPPLQKPRNWPQIAALYGGLSILTGSPVVELNRAAAVRRSRGPGGRLAIAEALALDDHLYCTQPGTSCCAGSSGLRMRLPPTGWRWSCSRRNRAAAA
jgi:hypothetical protein